jgi:hypothetical protein
MPKRLIAFDEDGTPIYVDDQESQDIKETVPTFDVLTPDPSYLQNPTTSDYFRYYIGQHIPGILKFAGATTGGLAPAALSGGAGLAASASGATVGAGLGSSIGESLKSISPRLFGQPSNNILRQSINDALTLGALGELTGFGVSKAISPSISRFMGDISGIIKNLSGKSPKEPVIRASIARKFTQVPAVSEKIAQFQTEEFVKKYELPESIIIKNLRQSMSGKAQLSLQKDLNDVRIGRMHFNDFTKKYLSDVSKVRRIHRIDPESTRLLAVNNLIRQTYKGQNNTINASKALDLLSGKNKEVYDEAIGKSHIKTIKDLLQKMQKYETKEAIGDRGLNYVKNRLTLALGGLITGSFGGATTGIAASAASIILGENALKRIVSNPEVAELAIKALETPIKDSSSKLIRNSLLFALRGTVVYYQDDKEDKPKRAYIDDNGNLTYEPPLLLKE